VRYVYLGDRFTADDWRGQPCDPVRDERGKCIVHRSRALAEFSGGRLVVVNRRRLRLIKDGDGGAAVEQMPVGFADRKPEAVVREAHPSEVAGKEAGGLAFAAIEDTRTGHCSFRAARGLLVQQNGAEAVDEVSQSRNMARCREGEDAESVQREAVVSSLFDLRKILDAEKLGHARIGGVVELLGDVSQLLQAGLILDWHGQLLPVRGADFAGATRPGPYPTPLTAPEAA
jgi:hypothetical protein